MPVLWHFVCFENRIVKKSVQVAVAIIVNAEQKVLIARRQAHQHQGNLWEFPGGKREVGESRFQALQREIQEEVGLHIEQAEPFMQIVHDYSDVEVELDIWSVTAFTGSASGNEGQLLEWCHLSELSNKKFPAANNEIVERLQTLVK